MELASHLQAAQVERNTERPCCNCKLQCTVSSESRQHMTRAPPVRRRRHCLVPCVLLPERRSQAKPSLMRHVEAASTERGGG